MEYYDCLNWAIVPILGGFIIVIFILCLLYYVLSFLTIRGVYNIICGTSVIICGSFIICGRFVICGSY